MTHPKPMIKRSRRLQAGLAGLSVLSALGAAVGLGLTTHTGSSQTSQGTASDTGSTPGAWGAGPVSKPANTTPQATTSGS
jgi:hypothetical protein